MFGYPTGVGALIARRDGLAKLRRRYFGGGSVEFVSVQNELARSKAGADALVDGTPNFLAMSPVADGLAWLDDLGMERVQQHVKRLTAELLQRLWRLGDRVVVYGPLDTNARGGTVAFNLRRKGNVLDYEVVEACARERGIAIRGGCFCNPGAAEHAFSIPPGRAKTCLRGAFSIARFRACLGDTPVGALRASMGIPTTTADLDRLLDLAAGLTA
jgi:selenocysteine lyase/cysteine desulfurase